MDFLENHRVKEGHDRFDWILDKSGNYSTRSMYKWITFRGMANRRMSKLWGSKLPTKLKVFAWLAVQDSLQSGVNLGNRNWKGCRNCCSCGVLETMDHIFFDCYVAQVIWRCFKEALGWDRVPRSMKDVFYHFITLRGSDYHIKLFTFVIIIWGLWNVRNKMAIEKRFPKSSKEVFGKIFQFVQRWHILLRKPDALKLSRAMEGVETWLMDFWSRSEEMEVEGVI